MPEEGVGISRRLLFKLAGATAAAAGLVGHGANKAAGHDLKPADPAYHYDEYEAIVNRRDLRVRQVYEWPNIKNEIMFANVRNGMNGFQFSYGLPADAIQVVVQAYATANAATYDDFIWEKFKLGERMGVNDPDTGEPALRNIWFASSVEAAADGEAPEDRSDPYYADAILRQRTGIPCLLTRKIHFQG